MKLRYMGWFIATAMVGGLISSAFTQKADKIGFVDFGVAFSQSQLKAQEEAQFNAKAQTLRDALNFISLNDIFTGDQLTQFQKLLLSDTQTPEQTQALQKLEADVSATLKTFDQLQQKSNPTADDTAQLTDLATRKNNTDRALSGLQTTFSNYMAGFKQKQAQDASDKIQAAAEAVAKKQGFSLVFSDNAAVYGGQDITPEVSKALGK